MTNNLPARFLSQASAFHGHLGPWLVLGLKAGAYARQKLAASPFELKAQIFCPAGTPYTCFVDGIQFSSGCTMGKGNISHVRSKGCRVEFMRNGKGTRPVKEVFRNQIPEFKSKDSSQGLTDRPSRLRLAVRPEVWVELHSRPDEGMAGAERLGREFARRQFEELLIEPRTERTSLASQRRRRVPRQN